MGDDSDMSPDVIDFLRAYGSANLLEAGLTTFSTSKVVKIVV